MVYLEVRVVPLGQLEWFHGWMVPGAGDSFGAQSTGGSTRRIEWFHGWVVPGVSTASDSTQKIYEVLMIVFYIPLYVVFFLQLGEFFGPFFLVFSRDQFLVVVTKIWS